MKREERVYRILVVDDHPIVRDGLAQVITAQADLEVCGDAAGLRDAMLAVEELRPDLALVDIFLEGSNGIELTKRIRGRFPEVKVLILSMHDEDVYAVRAVRAGASGYVRKQEASRRIVEAIRTVLSGGRYVSEKVARMLADSDGAAAGAAPEETLGRLTDREMEVFEMFGRGVTRAEIAERLRISVKTVEAHRAHIRDKLGLKHAADLLHQAWLWTRDRM